MFVTETYYSIAIYRFEKGSEIAIPCGLITEQNAARIRDIPYQPAGKPYIWTDLNQDGQFDEEEFTIIEIPNREIDGMYSGEWSFSVDDAGDIWMSDNFSNGKAGTKRIYLFATTEMIAGIVPKYELDMAAARDYSDELYIVRRMQYLSESDVMYISGFTYDFPWQFDEFYTAGRVLYRFDNWSKNPTVHEGYPIGLSYIGDGSYQDSSDPFQVIFSFTVIDDRLFLAYQREGSVGYEQEMHVIDADSAELLGVLHPDWTLMGEHFGLIDICYAINGIKRKDGTYKVLVQEDRHNKNILYTVWDTPTAKKTYWEAYDAYQNDNNLSVALNLAQKNLESVQISTESGSVLHSKYWVTRSEYNAYEIAIHTAQSVLDNSSASTLQISDAINALSKAREVFGQAKKSGSKVNETELVTKYLNQASKEKLRTDIAYGILDESIWDLNITLDTWDTSVPNKNTSIFGTLYDEEYLYIGVKVWDDTLYRYRPDDIDAPYHYDDVELLLGYSSAQSDLPIPLNIRIIKGYDNPKLIIFGSEVREGSILHGTHDFSGGYTVAFAIEWEILGITPDEGMSIGVNVASLNKLYWNGAPRTVYQSWAPIEWDAENGYNPTTSLGDLFLAAPEIPVSLPVTGGYVFWHILAVFGVLLCLTGTWLREKKSN
jgi:hypothetical protein